MANTITLKKSSTPGSIPLVSDLTLGELAINTNDGKVFTKKVDNSIVEIGKTSTSQELLDSIKTVDGTGSGLDADLLDGLDSTDFATSAQGTLADDALPATNGTSTGLYETVGTLSGTVIDVSTANVFVDAISADKTYTFTGFTTDASSVEVHLTVTGSPIVTFTGAIFKTTPVIAPGLMVLVFTSVDNGASIIGAIVQDAA